MNICSYCKKDFKYNSKLKIHLNSNKPCYIPNIIKNIEDFIPEEDYDLKTRKKGYIKKDDELYYCLFCEQNSSVQSDISKHVKKNCSVLRDKYKEKFNKDREMICVQEYSELKYNLNDIYDFTLNILPFKEKIVELGKEDLSVIRERQIKYLFANPKTTIQKLNKLLSFNKKFINQWNIHYLKDGNILYYKNKKWNIECKDDFFETIYLERQNQIYELEKKYGKNILKYTNSFFYTMNLIRNEVKKVDKIKEYGKNKKELIDNIHNNIKNMFIESIINYVDKKNEIVKNYFSHLKNE